MSLILHSIELRDVAAVAHLKIDDLPTTGVVVIHGPNEAGKSTIVTAIDTLFKHRYSSKNKFVRALEPKGRDAGPQVTVEATIGPYRFEMSKRWLKAKKAELKIRQPKPQQFVGDAAEDKFEAIIKEFLDEGLRDSLFFAQGDPGDSLAAAGISSLVDALNRRDPLPAAEAAEVSDGSWADSHSKEHGLLLAVEQELSRYITLKTGKPTGRFRQVGEDLARYRGELQEATQQLRAFDSTVLDFQRAEQAQADAAAQLPEVIASITARTEELARARQLEEKAAHSRQRVEHATVVLDQARAQSQHRAELAAEVERLAQTVAAAQERAAAARLRADEVEQQRADLHAVLEGHRTELKAARESHSGALAEVTRAQAAVDLIELEKQIDSVSQLRQRRDERRREEQDWEPKISAEQLAQLREAATEMRIATEIAQQASSKLLLSTTGPQTAISVDGVEMLVDDAETTVDLADGTTITIGEVSARFVAGRNHHQSETPADKAQAAREFYDSLLQKFHVSSLAAAQESNEAWESLIAQYQDAESQLRIALGNEDEELWQRRRAELAATRGSEPVAPLAEAQERLAEINALIAGIEAQIERTEALLLPLQNHAAAVDAARAEAQREVAVEDQQRLSAKLRAAEHEQSSDAVDTAVREATEQAKQAQQEYEEIVQAVELAQPAMVESLLRGDESLRDALLKQQREAENQQLSLSAAIEHQRGVADAVASAEVLVDQAEQEWDGLRRQQEAAAYLRDLLLKHQAEARQRYAEPFSRKLEELARRVYGSGTKFILSEDLQVEARFSDGISVEHDLLSGGAKEQLAIMTRFAIADLVGQGQAVPVVIDDALGSTDAVRIQHMAALFEDIGRASQVMVLTCVPSRYQRIPSRTEYHIDDLKQSGGSSSPGN